jgi:hypothetical protein
VVSALGFEPDGEIDHIGPFVFHVDNGNEIPFCHGRLMNRNGYNGDGEKKTLER